MAPQSVRVSICDATALERGPRMTAEPCTNRCVGQGATVVVVVVEEVVVTVVVEEEEEEVVVKLRAVTAAPAQSSW
jgi:hypothetical protein